MAGLLRFQVLGPVVAHDEHGPVPLGPARQRTVLAVLLTEPGKVVSLDQLVDRVWGDVPPQRARRTLHVYLSRLRSVLAGAGGPLLTRRSRSYLLEVDESAVDLYQFRALAAQARAATDDEATALWCDALALWRGAPFADLDCDWLSGVAVALEAERFAAISDRNDVLLRRGEHARLVPELSAVAAEHPLDERLAGQLMLALYRCGRQADALAHYRLIHDRLVEELGSDPGAALRQLHQRILRQEESPAPASTLVVVAGEPTGPPAAAVAQLPADIASFTGRAEVLRQLDALPGPAGDPPSTVVITAIGGSAGIGKTALAVHWAHRVADQFPDGQLYLNLRGFDPASQAMPPAEALRSLLELLQVPPQRIPASVEAQAGLYRSRLASSRMLVVLDNARDADQVRPLLPGSPGSMVVVTSRDQLAGLVATEGARPVRLDVLDDDEARALLAGRLGAQRVAAEPGAVDEILKACAGLPLALAIVAARAALQPDFPLGGYAEELADARHRLDALSGLDPATDVRTVFSWSYNGLRPESARLFRFLGLHPGPDIGLNGAASLAGLPAPQVRRLLSELASAHLLTEPVPGRYALHDLLRAYAAELAQAVDPDPARHAAQHRILDYYLHSTHAADQWLPASRDPIVLTPPQLGVVPERFPGNAEAREWLTAELRVLLAIIAQPLDAEFDLQVQQLAWALNTFLLWRGLWHHQVTAQSAGLRAAHRRGGQSEQADIRRRLAYACAMLGQRAEARAHSQQALALYEAVGDHTGQARARLSLMWLAEQEGRYLDALQHAERCLEAARAAGHRVVQALARNGVGWCHSLLGEHEKAIIHCQQALAELQELDEPVSMSDVWDSLGHAHHHLGQHQQAIDYYQQAVDRCREFGDRRHEAAILTHLGETYHATGDDQAAREAWQRALDIFDEIGHPDADEIRKRL